MSTSGNGSAAEPARIVRDDSGVDSFQPAAVDFDLAQVADVSVTVPPDESRIFTLSEPRGPVADRFRYLGMRLRELRHQAKLQKVVITSPLPRDGKSTVTMNLAASLAEGGRRTVLVVEADMHHPTLAGSLGIPRSAGLAEAIEGCRSGLPDVKRIQPLGCYLLEAGKAEGNPSDLLQTGAFVRIIAELSGRFDWVIVDSPPVAPLTDALAVARQCDAALLVVRAHETPCEAVEDALALLGPGKVAGIVFNGAEGLNHLYHKYSHYYGRK